jgi:hypothetical protein
MQEREAVMRISVKDEAMVATLKVEGRVVGPWATELKRIWHDLWTSTRPKRLRLDIRGVTFADQEGNKILGEIVRVTGAEIVADSPLTQHFAKLAMAATIVGPEKN